MTVTYSTIGQNAIADGIVDLCDAGAGAGNIQVATTAFASILASFTLSDPAYGAASSATAVLSGTPLTDVSADNTGTAAVWRARDSNNVVVYDGPVAGAGGGDINLSTNARNAGLDGMAALCNGGDLQFATDSGFGTVLLTLSLNATAFATASAGSAVLDTTGLSGAASAGTATFFRFRTSGAAEVFRGTVGSGSGDMSFDSNIWVASQPITVSGWTATMAATIASSDGALVINNTAIVAGQNVEITSGDFDQPATAA